METLAIQTYYAGFHGNRHTPGETSPGYLRLGEMKIEIEMDLPPSVNNLYRLGKGNVYRSPKYVNWRNATLWSVSLQAQFRKISTEYKLTIRVVKPDKRKRDLDNILKALSDILESAGVIENDHFCQHIDLAWVKEGPPCYIVIESMGEDDGEAKQLRKKRK